jgi:hypothetical protein
MGNNTSDDLVPASNSVKPRAWLGIDNGISGAIAVLTQDRILVLVEKFSTKVVAKNNHIDSLALYGRLKAMAEQYRMTAVLELPAMQFGQFGGRTNAKAIQSTGISYGRILSILDVLGIPAVIKASSQWTPEFWARGKDNDTKELSVNMAFALFPGIKAQLTTGHLGKTVKPNHNATDAILMAEFGRRKNL